jgi:hypothetical protein
LNVEYGLLGISLASDFYKPMFRNSVSIPSSWVGRTDAVTKRRSGIYTGKRGAGYEVERSNGKEEQSGGSEKCTTSLGVDSHISESLLIVQCCNSC